MSLESKVAHESHNHEHKGENMEQKEKTWEKKCLKVMHRIAHGGFAEFANAHGEYVKNMLNRPSTCVCCIDGRIAPQYDAVAIAGSGILIKDDAEAKTKLVNSLIAKGIKKVTLHEDCGAVGLYAKQKGITLEQAKKDALEWARELTKLIGGDEEPEMLPVVQDFHSETCAYIVPDNFSLKEIKEDDSPLTEFVISASSVSFVNLLKQIEIALMIARGDHGFGKHFTKETPFTVVIVAKNDKELHEMKSNPEIIRLIEAQDGCAVIEGFSIENV